MVLKRTVKRTVKDGKKRRSVKRTTARRTNKRTKRQIRGGKKRRTKRRTKRKTKRQIRGGKKRTRGGGLFGAQRRPLVGAASNRQHSGTCGERGLAETIIYHPEMGKPVISGIGKSEEDAAVFKQMPTVSDTAAADAVAAAATAVPAVGGGFKSNREHNLTSKYKIWLEQNKPIDATTNVPTLLDKTNPLAYVIVEHVYNHCRAKAENVFNPGGISMKVARGIEANKGKIGAAGAGVAGIGAVATLATAAPVAAGVAAGVAATTGALYGAKNAFGKTSWGQAFKIGRDAQQGQRAAAAQQGQRAAQQVAVGNVAPAPAVGRQDVNVDEFLFLAGLKESGLCLLQGDGLEQAVKDVNIESLASDLTWINLDENVMLRKLKKYYETECAPPL